MRRLLSRIALLAVCSLALVGVAGAGTASAGSCTSQVGIVGLTGSPTTDYFGWQAWCTGYIDKVQIQTATFYGYGTMGVLAWGCTSCTSGVYNLTAVGGGQSNIGVTNYFCIPLAGCTSNYPRWCTGGVTGNPNSPGTPSPMAGYIYFRIHQTSTNSWGDYHVASGSNELHLVAC